MKIRLKFEPCVFNTVGLTDMTLSINRQWWKNKRTDALQYHHTWKHYTLGLRAPVLWHTKTNKVTLNPVRFGYHVDSSGRVHIYGGVVYLMLDTDKKRPGYTALKTQRFGPVEIASSSVK
jgi:hypothetical protein